MESCNDPLSVAVAAADAFFYGAPPPQWLWHLDVWRLFSGDGWLVTGTRDAIILDKKATVSV